MSSYIVSTRLPNTDPTASAFADLTHALLDELCADFERCMGVPFEGGSGILFASDVLLALHGPGASWERFEVGAFESWIRTNAPGFVVALGAMLVDLMAFTNYLARTGRIAPERAIETEARAREVIAAGPTAALPMNRAERRAAARRKRRLH